MIYVLDFQPFCTVHVHFNSAATESVTVVAGRLTHLHEISCGPDAHAGHGLPLASGEAGVAGTLAGEGAE